MKKYHRFVIAKAAMSSEWRGNDEDLERVAEIAQELAPPGWIVNGEFGSYKSAENVDDYPENLWIQVLNIHATEAPNAWQGGRPGKRRKGLA